MAKTGKTYLVPFKSEAAKARLRKWMGIHNGMTILKSDWGYVDDNWMHDIIDSYLIKITNPKTELLFMLSFPEAKDIDGLDRNADVDWRLYPNSL